MFEISLNNFRGFHQQPFVPVRPITLLIGENSAGKSSFLAALKYLCDFVSPRDVPNFNSDPFQLGTFDQISHFRGGRGGRAREFGLSLKETVTIQKSRISDIKGKFDTRIDIIFSSVESHASISLVKITANSESLTATTSAGGIVIEYTNAENKKTLIEDTKLIQPLAKAELARHWPLMLQSILFRALSVELRDGKERLPEEINDAVFRLAEIAEAIGRQTTVRNEATSAIRTKPQRTYTPGTEKEDGEGSHVPYEIAKLYRSRAKNKSGWEELKKSIERFGHTSEMFKELSVKSFGQTASDPFQIQFANYGPKTNLVDLGYGTSQILPILYSIAVARENSRFLIQQPEVHLHPKAQAALGQYIVDAWKRNRIQFVLETHSDFLVDRIKISVADKIIQAEDVSILFFERQKLENVITPINLDEMGEPIDPPENYRAFFIGEQMRILGM